MRISQVFLCYNLNGDKCMKLVVKKESKLLEYLIDNTSKSRKDLKAYLKYGNIKVNGKITTKYDKLLKVDDVLEISESKNKNEDLNIVFENKDIIVIDKEPGLLTMSSDSEKEKTAYKLVMYYLKNINKNNRVFIVHRLDRETSGLLLFAKNEITKNKLQSNWDNNTKKYIGIVEGITKESDTIESFLKENDEYIVYSSNTGKKAITSYKRIKHNEKYSMLDINIKTGRKNQIRVHMKDINHAIIGDKKYNSKTNPIKRLGLHAYYLEILLDDKKYIFKSEIPSSFNKVFR